MASKTIQPVVTASAPPLDVERGRSDRDPAPAIPARPREASQPAVDQTAKPKLWLWLVMIGTSAAAWHYRLAWMPFVAPLRLLLITWLPFIAPLFPNSADPKPKQPPRAMPVVTARVHQRDMEIFLNGLGTVTAFKTVTVKSRVDGELINVAFTEGQMVHEGELIAEIDPRPFEVQLAQAEGQLARDEATHKSARLTLDRYMQLLASKTLPQQQIDEQIALLKQTEGAIKTDQAMIANAKLQLNYCRIVAPISGRIGLRIVDQGNIVRANDTTGLAVVTQLQPIALVFTIPQDEIARVQKNMREGHQPAVDAFDRDFTTKLASGKLQAIDNQVDPTTGTVRLKAVFENEDGLLFPNQFVNARLLVETKQDAVVIPSSAVQRGPNSTFVYVVKEDETVELRPVEIGPAEGGETAIESGLNVNELVVTGGIDKLQPGAKVVLREKAATASVGANKEAAPATESKGSR